MHAPIPMFGGLRVDALWLGIAVIVLVLGFVALLCLIGRR